MLRNNKLKKFLFRAVGHTPAVSLESLAHCQYGACLKLFLYYIGVHSKWHHGVYTKGLFSLMARLLSLKNVFL